jgi:hypothetical protein
VPEHRANLEHRLSDGASLAYTPYRPYVPFTSSSLREGRHSSHTQRRSLHSNQSSDLTFADSLYRPIGSPSRATTPFNPLSSPITHPDTLPATTPFDPPSSPIAVSPVTTTHPDIPPAATVTSIAPNLIVTQHNKDFVDDEPPFPTNDSTVMDQDISTHPSPAHSTVMDQDASTAPPLPLVNPPSRPLPAHHLPTDTPP